MKPKLIRITTVPISLKVLLKDQLRFMTKYFDVLAISSGQKELSDVEVDEGVRTIAVDMSRQITPFKDLVSLIKMVFVFLNEKPDIVHTHTPKAGIVGMLAAWITRVPHRLHTVAGLPVMEAQGKKRKILLFVEKLTYACATKVYPNSKGLKSYILDNNLTTQTKLKVLANGSSNGIDTKYFDPALYEDSKQKDNKFNFIFVGRIVKDKGIDELLYAFDKLSARYDDISLTILGSFEDDLDPISHISKDILKNNSAINNLGFQEDIRPFLANADCFVLPTYREGFPNVVLQACSMGLASIVTDINGCNEIVTDQKNGLIIPPKDKEALYDAMEKFVLYRDLSDKLSINTRDDIISKYDRVEFHKTILDEYKGLLDD
jgi:glycosyltransferase involved in cell wall biosynthesis